MIHILNRGCPSCLESLEFLNIHSCQIFCGKRLRWIEISSTLQTRDEWKLLEYWTTYIDGNMVIGHFYRKDLNWLTILTKYVTFDEMTSFSSWFKSRCPETVWLLLRLFEERLRWFRTNSCCHCWHWYWDWDSNMTEHSSVIRVSVSCCLWHLQGRPQDKRLLCQIFFLANVPEIFF